MSELKVYKRKPDRKEQCAEVPGTPVINQVYGRRWRRKLDEKTFESSSNETNIDSDESSERVDLVEKEQSSDGTESISLDFVVKLDSNTSLSLNAGEVKEQSFAPGFDLNVEDKSTCLISTVDGLNISEKYSDSVLSDDPSMELPNLFEPKASQPYAMSQDNGFMRESVTYEHILVNGCLDTKKRRQTPKKKIHRPKVAFDDKPKKPKHATTNQVREKKPRLATPKQTREKKPRLAAAKQAKGKKSENVTRHTSPSLEIMEISETKAPVARALDFLSESLDAVPFSSLIPIKKRRCKRRKKLNWFNFPVMSGGKSLKNGKKKSFKVTWFRRKRILQRKRRMPRKVTRGDAEPNTVSVSIIGGDEMVKEKAVEVLDPVTGNKSPMISGNIVEMDVLATREIEPVTNKRNPKTTTSKSALKPRGRGGPVRKKDIDFLIKKIKSLYISDKTLVLYRKPLKKIGPNIVLDLEDVRVYNKLVGIDADRIQNDSPSEEKEKWWKRERDVFVGRVASFIACMQQIQGDRSFRKWRGSVMDSTIGVLLTQNVSDYLSSNAFMSLAAMFPARRKESAASESESNVSNPSLSQESVGSNMTEYDVEGNQYFVLEPELERKELEKATDGLVGDFEESRTNSGRNGCLQLMSNINLPTNSNADLLNGGFAGKLHMINVDGVSGSIVQRQGTKMPNNFRSKIPKLKERDYSNMGFGKRKSTPKNQEGEKQIDWESMRIKYSTQRSEDQNDIVDWEAVRIADVNQLATCIEKRGQQNRLAETIQKLLNRVFSLHNCLDLEWLRNTPPDLAKQCLLEIEGLGLKSVECVRLLSLEQVAFPVDVNVARIVVRLGWVPLQPLPEELQLHQLDLFPVLDKIQIYLWPRLCTLPQRTLYKLHFQLITFGKVFCTKSKPNCNACPMRDNCRHFHSQYASAKKALPYDNLKSSSASTSSPRTSSTSFSSEAIHLLDIEDQHKLFEPIIEEPLESSSEFEALRSLEPEFQEIEYDSEGVPIFKLNNQALKENNLMFEDGEFRNALVALHPKATSKSPTKLKQNIRLRTEHLVYELPRNHILLRGQGLEQTESDDDVQYHLAIWRPGETPVSSELPKKRCNSVGSELCNEYTCFDCNGIREQDVDVVRGTLLIPCRVANRGSFPLNGTYFQINEVFADHETSLRPIIVPRKWIYNLRTTTAYFGTSISAILRGASEECIKECFKTGIICVRAFERNNSVPEPLQKRFHDMEKGKGKGKEKEKEKGKGKGKKTEPKVKLQKTIKW